MSIWKRCLIMAFAAFLVIPAVAADAKVQTGKAVSVFTLKDVNGKAYGLSSVKDRSMVVLYFFDAASRPSQEFLLTIDNLARKYQEAGLTVLGVTASKKDAVTSFVRKANPRFPILLDDARISEAYDAKLILPVTCIVGPNLKLLDHFQGSGKTSNAMLVRLSERTLQQNQLKLASAISEAVVKSDPKNEKARLVQGYAALKAGRLADAEKTFAALAAEGGHSEVLGKEGLASVYARKGQSDKALKAAEDVEKKAPDRPYVHVIKGDILYAKNKKQAEGEYQKAIQKKGGETYQTASAYNKMGRLMASAGKYDKSRQLYDQAIEIDPYYVEAMTNKGLTYEKEGSFDKALDAYRKGEAANKDDVFASALAKRASDMLALKDDSKRKERVDKLVKDLAERFRSQKNLAAKAGEDTWTSRPMVISFVDFEESGSLSERDGVSTVITAELADGLNSSGRVKVVERVIIDSLLQELNLGTSDLADPQTALKLGKVLAAKVIGTGTLLNMPGSTMMSIRLIDTETSGISKVINRQIPEGEPLKKELSAINREILASVMQSYPLHAYVVNADAKQIMINLGSNQGVVAGTTFEVIEEKPAIEYKGKMLKASPEAVARVEVVKVEPDLSYCRVVDQKRPIRQDDKVVEKIDEAVTKG